MNDKFKVFTIKETEKEILAYGEHWRLGYTKPCLLLERDEGPFRYVMGKNV